MAYSCRAASSKVFFVGRTNIEAAGTSLTTSPRVDYDTVMTTPATVSGLASVIQARQLRSLDGVYEVHNVAGMGVSWVIEDDKFTMASYVQCKARTDNSTGTRMLVSKIGGYNSWTSPTKKVRKQCCITTPPPL